MFNLYDPTTRLPPPLQGHPSCGNPNCQNPYPHVAFAACGFAQALAFFANPEGVVVSKSTSVFRMQGSFDLVPPVEYNPYKYNPYKT